MNLYLSSRSPLYSAFSTEDGQVIYKVETPMVGVGRTAVISRVIPNDVPPEGEEVDPDMKDRYAFMASVEFNWLSSSIIKLVDREFTTESYFRKEGWGPRGHHRAFTGPDRREYKWLLKRYHTELILNDPTKATVARFHTKSFGIIGEARPACLELEITPLGEHMVDTILVTFIYAEKRRKDAE